MPWKLRQRLKSLVCKPRTWWTSGSHHKPGETWPRRALGGNQALTPSAQTPSLQNLGEQTSVLSHQALCTRHVPCPGHHFFLLWAEYRHKCVCVLTHTGVQVCKYFYPEPPASDHVNRSSPRGPALNSWILLASSHCFSVKTHPKGGKPGCHHHLSPCPVVQFYHHRHSNIGPPLMARPSSPWKQPDQPEHGAQVSPVSDFWSDLDRPLPHAPDWGCAVHVNIVRFSFYSLPSVFRSPTPKFCFKTCVS